ncbi:uncharacterized protein JCM15063_001081 [Sporobolomyces koalae]|uniref:uncharacterized protein n=1 Tax=Sporobolomyces koalae TaxID=500713 RepID=UPI003178600F
MPPLPDTHPDGDPFAEQDKLKEADSLLGRLEQQAKLEAQRQGLDEHGMPIPANKDKRGATSLGTTRDGKEILLHDSSDEEAFSEGEAQMTDPGDDVDRDSDAAENDDDDDEDDVDDEDRDSQDGSGLEGPDANRKKQRDARNEDDDDEDDEDSDDEEDSEEDDSASSVGTGEGPREGDPDADVSMADGESTDPTKPRSPVKSSSAKVTGPDGAVVDGEPVGPDGEPKKEKKKRRRRALNRSPSPPPLEPRKAPPTVRMPLTLGPRDSGAPSSFNVIALAKKSGILPPDEPSKKEAVSDAEESESDGQGGRRKKDKGKAKVEGDPESREGSGPPMKKRKRGPNVIVGRFGGYDTEDPFVDDTELALYEPRHYVRPRREGYFVCIGDIECAPKRGGNRRPKTDENGNPVSGAARRGSKKYVIGPDGKPIPVDTPLAGPSSGKIETPFGTTGAPAFGTESEKPVRQPGEFSQELEENFEMLKVESDKESYEVKNKFPPHLKELLTSVAYRALDLGEFDEYFFARLPSIFPYNKFTLTKLVKREVFQKRMNDLTTRQDELLEVLKECIKETYDEQKKEFEQHYAEWEKEKESEGTKGDAPVSTIPTFGAAAPPPQTPGAGDGSPAPGTDGVNPDEDKEPKFKFRFNEKMRSALYWACDLEDRKSTLIEEKQKLEKSTTREVNPEKPWNTKTARKAIYSKITEFWSDGVVASNQLSREISNYKLKLKKAGEIDV